ncbi:cyclic pyranopterin monophosphate synthase MoaC [Candidatus Methylacidiphilum fumarolicum]|uniref:Molybdenum cofactor biosynthesis protein C n=3 Tax=Candidatus Methylacidiphilum fumarolicum TaxID=591154 RepID=I0K1G8_METFB|nr:cyclic pyranopterin monophosphate synthase MoaC [Candidatus Methylacidiphilum fumarolicum]MBW6415906.1 cyclic pyranopterin monophosphate synthase MoaC [Candidatus Methylacidiphilum fumarolicum]TFE66670.1 molybdenum cofactor biosynthesis protein C [Candidatus Methylacidiphilum fumarolicum]TFE72539.1 cyclic pyranopterin monophosphate synthase MoaC [Candidatus Methylacidiphilum fumarolicum]TFE74348.1 cyclic pyranopterin monophosphate synthase MoaC [Candidatus Methylacidiphilum fumarolicum]TFE7
MELASQESRESSFSHLSPSGEARMVNVTDKAVQKRMAIAEGFITLSQETIGLLQAKAMPKGDVLTVAKIASIMAAKKTGELIPLAHTIGLSYADTHFEIEETGIRVVARAESVAKTGVEMEALVMVSVALLTLYDMCKAVDKSMVIGQIRLIEKKKE